MNGPDLRPEVRVAYINPDGTIDTTGQEAFGYYESLPCPGDVIVEASLLDGAPEAVVVVGRQLIIPDPQEPRWWIIVRPASSGYWRDVWQLDVETNQAFAEMREEQSREFEKSLRAAKRKKPK
ncbi:hypothetical protein SAMN05428969_2847 [Devosia sp. YR412]|uniref:hypothetical protein n=1 Tax=Devosia sp. YR412 TaxID=1881030 RepID=UPI0008B11746|nr:hypothetical protein [Devosia sp. YR412]SEQ38268.1 hypothetical protein SAMN05428969_2847 [Devosia sp. YR412]